MSVMIEDEEEVEVAKEVRIWRVACDERSESRKG